MPQVRCSCGYKAGVPDKSEPREMACPLCGRAIRIPASAPGDSSAPSGGLASLEPMGGGKASSQSGPAKSDGSSFDPFSDLRAPVHTHGPVSDARAEKQFKATIMTVGVIFGGIVVLVGLIWGVSSIVGGGGSGSGGSSGSSSSANNGSANQSQQPRTNASIGLGGGEGESGTAKSGKGRGGSDRGHGRGAADEGNETGSAKGPPTRTENQSKNTGTDEGAESDSKVAEKTNISIDEKQLAELRKEGSKGEATGNLSSALPEDGLNVPSLAPDFSSILKRKGSGGFGARGVAGRAQRVQNGATAEVERAIEMGVRWLATVQSAEGRWDPKPFGGGDNVDLGVTGLCLLVFLGEGHHPASKTQFSAQVDRGVNWVLGRQDATTGGMNSSTFYEQGISLMVLSETYALTQDEKYKEPAQKLLNFIVSKSSPNGGYTYGGPGSDTSVTGFQIMGIKSAMMAGLTVPEDAVLRVHTYLRVCTLDDGRAGYQEQSDPKISMTSVAMCCRLFLGYGLEDAMVIKAGDLIAKNGPKVDDEYFTYYATYCMFQVGGPKWRDWNKIFRPGVIALQEQKTKGLVGSFNPGGTNGAGAGGRVYTTAMYLLTLQVYARFLPMYR
jgi:hypothetical protein